MDRYDEIKLLIEDESSIAEFADFGDGTTDEWIEKAEAALELTLPPSYKWWLRNYRGGEIGGEEIYSIYGQDFDSVVGGDIVYMHRTNLNASLFEPNQLVICDSDIDGAFYFDTSAASEDGEYQVYSAATESVYAQDFLDFLRKRINAFSV